MPGQRERLLERGLEPRRVREVAGDSIHGRNRVTAPEVGHEGVELLPRASEDRHPEAARGVDLGESLSEAVRRSDEDYPLHAVPPKAGIFADTAVRATGLPLPRASRGSRRARTRAPRARRMAHR